MHGDSFPHKHICVFFIFFAQPSKFPYQTHQRANIEPISPLHAKHFNQNAHAFKFICFPMRRGWEQSQMRTNFCRVNSTSVFCMHLRKVTSTSLHSVDPVLWKCSCGTWAGSHTHITIHKPISYQVSSTDYLPFRYPTPACVDSVIVLLFMSSLVLNICTKIHLIYLIIVSCPLRNILIASLREKERRGRETTTCNLDFKASCNPDRREKPSTHRCFFFPLDVMPSILFASFYFVPSRKMWSSFPLFSILKS